MTEVVFYEKPGCVNNTRQKTLLRALGHVVDERNLLTESWTTDLLASYFGSKPVVQWFNTTAPKVKSGEVNPLLLDAEQALRLMVAEPLLIRRPLIDSAYGRVSGFDDCDVLRSLGVQLDPDVDLQTCVKTTAKGVCRPPGESP